MQPNPRQLTLLSVVQAQGSVTVEQLAETLGVTLQTVRRDVQRLADEGLLARFHGGVRVPSSTTENIAHQQRENLNAEGKSCIARAVAAAVPNDCSLILNIGTTTEAIARALLHHSGLRVITNNLNVASILSTNPQCEVIVVGGVVRGRDQGIVGEAAVDFIRQFKVDLALIGISGIEADANVDGWEILFDVFISKFFEFLYVFKSCTAGIFCVIWIENRGTKKSHNGIAHVFVESSSILKNDFGHRGQIRVQEIAQFMRIKFF